MNIPAISGGMFCRSNRPGFCLNMDILISSFSLVALAEIGDKTQLLSILLAARFKNFWPIFFGVLIATIVNHAGSAYVGKVISEYVTGNTLNYITSAIFIVLGFWLLIPDKMDEDVTRKDDGVFITSLITFFLAEMGDKTQFATITLGAEYSNTWLVIIGTTIGMMFANTPAILFGEKILKVIPLKKFRIIASLFFIGFGIYIQFHK